MHVLLHQVERRIHMLLLLVLLVLLLQLQMLLQMQLVLLMLLHHHLISSADPCNMLQRERVRGKLTFIATAADSVVIAAAAVVVAVAAGATARIGTRRLVCRGAGLLWSLRPRWAVVNTVPTVQFGLVLLLPLHASILEPDFDLSLCEAEGVCNLDPPAPRQVTVEVELLLQFQGLVPGVGLTATFAFCNIKGENK